MKKGHSHRGSVTRAFSTIKRYSEDEEYRKRKNEKSKKYRKKHRKRRLAYSREQEKLLNEFANKRCKVCNKLLNHRTKTGFCVKHYREWKYGKKKVRNPIILMFSRLIKKLQ